MYSVLSWAYYRSFPRRHAEADVRDDKSENRERLRGDLPLLTTISYDRHVVKSCADHLPAKSPLLAFRPHPTPIFWHGDGVPDNALRKVTLTHPRGLQATPQTCAMQRKELQVTECRK